MRTISFFLCGVFFLLATTISAAEIKPVVSPDGQIAVQFAVDEELTYTVTYRDTTIVAPSRLGLEFQDATPFGSFRPEKVTAIQDDATWEYPWGRQRVYRDRYSGVLLELVEKQAPNRPLGIECRVYDDGVAFRYLIDEKTIGGNRYTLQRDLTEYRFPGDPVAWLADYRSARSNQEQDFPKQRLGDLSPDAYAGCPLVVQMNEAGPYVALAEAELNHWGGLYFRSAPWKNGVVLFESGIMRKGEKVKSFEIDLKEIDRLVLECNDGGDGRSYDHADWVDLELTDQEGKKTRLSELKPVEITQGYGRTRTDKSCDDNVLRIAGQSYDNGFGTHADGRIVFRLDGRYAKLRGAVGVDDEVTKTGTVGFRVHGFSKSTSPETAIEARLAPRLDGRGVADTAAPDRSPWRLIMIAPKAINLLDQTILMNVSAPADPNTDWSWVKAGTASWEWWSAGGWQMNTKSLKEYIDFAAEMGWTYHLIDAPWYHREKGKVNTILKGRGNVDIEEVARYAREKGIRLILWLHYDDVVHQMNEAFAYYEKLGIAGVKIDFMDRDDQEMVEWYDMTVKKAAAHKLVVDFHGAYKPTGYRRKMPNLINREGIKGNEYNRWSRISPEHYCTLPFTRLILGPGDFTPGAFQTRFFDAPNIPNVKTTQGIGTRAHELAISVIYDSPLLCLCDQHHVYRAYPESLEFYRHLPSVWDESRGVEGEIGEYVAVLRRKGDQWYYAAITDRHPRILQLPLDFLGDGPYRATVYADTPETEKDPRIVGITRQTVDRSRKLEINMIHEGGQVIVFTKEKP